MQPLRALRANTETDVVMTRKFTNSKNDQIEEAVQYCLESNVWCHKALQTGQFPPMKDWETINQRLGEVKLQIITTEKKKKKQKKKNFMTPFYGWG